MKNCRMSEKTKCSFFIIFLCNTTYYSTCSILLGRKIMLGEKTCMCVYVREREREREREGGRERLRFDVLVMLHVYVLVLVDHDEVR